MVSVIICSYNPRQDYIQRCIEALRSQTLTYDRWELLVIDNRSDEPLACWLDLAWHPDAQIIREEQLGLTPARLRGIRESKGGLLVFVDDDNLLDANYLEVALRTADKKPFLGSWSGQCRPEFQHPPPDWTRRYWELLVIREFDTDLWSNVPLSPPAPIPYGAGLCVRRDVAEQYVRLHQNGKRYFQLGRTGMSLMGSEDLDLGACACDLGYGWGIIATLKLTHIIPPERLTLDYLAKLAEGSYYSTGVLYAQRGLRTPKRALLGRCMDFVRTIRLRHPHREMLKAVYRGRDRAFREQDRIEPRSINPD